MRRVNSLMLLGGAMVCVLGSPTLSKSAFVEKNLNLMVKVPGGSYIMGPSRPDWQAGNTVPPHRVKLTGFYISRYNTSYGLYDAYTNLSGQPLIQKKNLDLFFRGAQYPANGITWSQANNYCQWLAKQTGLPFSLPTEAQYEYVARNLGQPNWAFATSNGKQELGKNFPDYNMFIRQKNNRFGILMPLPVGSIPCTPMGICGLNGEVNEWVKDWYDPHYYAHSPVDNPQGPSTGIKRVIRSGGAQGDPGYANSFGRDGLRPKVANGGFRCVINSTKPLS